MAKHFSKNIKRQAVHTRIRKRIHGTAERPRLNVYRSLTHIYVQLIDDVKGVTLASASTVDKTIRAQNKSGGNIASAKVIGTEIAKRAKSLGDAVNAIRIMPFSLLGSFRPALHP